MKRSHILRIFALAGLFIFTTCGKESKLKNIVYEGVVYDDNVSNKPLAGVTILLQACSNTFNGALEDCGDKRYTVGQALTDNNGHFYIKNNAAKTNWYFVHKQKDNYGDAVGNEKGTDENGLHSTTYTTIFLR